MTRSDDARRQIAALRERIAALNAASLRISASLDLDTVLTEILEGARGHAGARFGVIASVNRAGATRDAGFSGFTAEQERELAAWPDRSRLFSQLRGLPGPLWLADLSDYVRALGLEPAPTFQSTFLAVSMRHRGADVGHLSLAADAISNACTHRAERRARADLEALVETSPVGVVVVGLRAGRVLLANREMRRIVGRLLPAELAREQVLEAIRVRLGDGPDAPFRECPLVGRLCAGETVRAEEAVLSVPDGPSVRTLVNATPVRSAGDAVRSAAVTFQDLAPLEETERMRSEFLSLVSHELRAPLSAITGSTLTLLEEVEDLDRAEMHEFHRIIEEQTRHMRGLINDLLDFGAHRRGHAVGGAGAAGAGRAGGAGARHVPGSGRPVRRAGRPAGQPAAGVSLLMRRRSGDASNAVAAKIRAMLAVVGSAY